MVSLEQIQSSNSRIATTLRPGLVAVFAGATSGIGETSLKQFAKHAAKPRIYFIGRSKESGNRVKGELQQLNPDGEYIYISADTSLIGTVDDVCREIKSKEQAINLLFLTAGTLVMGKDTEEGLNYPTAVAYYGRIRFIVNLLPLLQLAPDLRRVVTVFAGTKEGQIDTNDFQGRHVPFLSRRGHVASMMTLALEAIAEKAPDVSFIHDFPGAVKSNLLKDVKSIHILVVRAVFKVLGPFLTLPFEEAGDRQVFFSTSARFPAGVSAEAAATSGVPLSQVVTVARGIDGKAGSGVYSTNIDGQSAPVKVEELLAKMRRDGMVQKLWSHTEGEFMRITKAAAV